MAFGKPFILGALPLCKYVEINPCVVEGGGAYSHYPRSVTQAIPGAAIIGDSRNPRLKKICERHSTRHFPLTRKCKIALVL